MARLGERLRRLEDARKPPRPPLRILRAIIAPDGSPSGYLIRSEGGGYRAATAAEVEGRDGVPTFALSEEDMAL